MPAGKSYQEQDPFNSPGSPRTANSDRIWLERLSDGIARYWRALPDLLTSPVEFRGQPDPDGGLGVRRAGDGRAQDVLRPAAGDLPFGPRRRALRPAEVRQPVRHDPDPASRTTGWIATRSRF